MHKRGGKLGDRKEYLCKDCGTTNPNDFLPKKKSVCARCRNKRVAKIESNKRIKWLDLKGNECIICGYNKYTGSLDFHHLDPSIKEHSSKRNWKKTEKGMENCILVCSNCHREIHAGLHPEYLIKGE